ncbi:hypothetical protein [Spongiimicrobium salis]|uniref:hypothetical protein n=1 Tax=Spongiimicrobium salis TaxID=1667022 RepID=UPI00374D67FE
MEKLSDQIIIRSALTIYINHMEGIPKDQHSPFTKPSIKRAKSLLDKEITYSSIGSNIAISRDGLPLRYLHDVRIGQVYLAEGKQYEVMDICATNVASRDSFVTGVVMKGPEGIFETNVRNIIESKDYELIKIPSSNVRETKKKEKPQDSGAE